MQPKNKNYEILDKILGKDGRLPIAEPYTQTELDGIEYLEYLEDSTKERLPKFDKFLPKAW